MIDLNISPDNLLRLSRKYPNEVIENPLLDVICLESPNIWRKIIISASIQILNNYLNTKIKLINRDQSFYISLICLNKHLDSIDQITCFSNETKDIIHRSISNFYGIEKNNLAVDVKKMIQISNTINGNNFEIKNSNFATRDWLWSSLMVILEFVKFIENENTLIINLLGYSCRASASKKKSKLINNGEKEEDIITSNTVVLQEKKWQLREIIKSLRSNKTIKHKTIKHKTIKHKTIKNIKNRKNYLVFSISGKLARLPTIFSQTEEK
jgi:hypothetical protein